MKFNNILALLVDVIIIPGLWFCDGLRLITLPEAVLGASIVVWTLVAQFYFRKKEGE